MRKTTVRNGMQLILVSLLIIIVSSFFLNSLGSLLSLSYSTHLRVYQAGIFLAAALGGYGVVVCAFGLVLPARASDHHVRLLSLFFLILAVVSMYLYLLSSFIVNPHEPGHDRLAPGESITI